jgi:phosphoribulokinase
MGDLVSTVSVMTLIADHVEDEESRASAFDTLVRHLSTNLEALRKGFSKAHAKYSLVPREDDDQKRGSVVPFEPRAGAEGGDAA